MSTEYDAGVSVSYKREKEQVVSGTHEEEKEAPSSSESLTVGSSKQCSKPDQGAGLFLVPNISSECSWVDESYCKFLSLSKIEGSSMNLAPSPGVLVTNEQEKETLSSSKSPLSERTKSFSKLDQPDGCTFLLNKHSDRSLVDDFYEPGVSVAYEEETVVSGSYKSKETPLCRESLTVESSKQCSESDQVAGFFFVPNIDSECSLADESYCKFLNLSKIEGSSMNLESSPGVFVTYEQEKVTSSSSKSSVTENTESCSELDQPADCSFVPNKHSECSLVDESFEPGVSVMHGEKETVMSGTNEEEKKTPLCSESLTVESSKQCSKPDQVAGLFFQPNIQSEYFLADESYRKFLSLSKIEGGSMNLESSPGVFVTYEQEKGTSSRSKSSVPANTKSCSKLKKPAVYSFVPNKHSECSLMDESYQKFLNFFKINGSSMILEYEPGVSVTYEKEKDTSVFVTCGEEKDISFSSETLATESTTTCSMSDKVVDLSFVPRRHCERSLVDESYQVFLSRLNIEGNFMSLKYVPGVSVTYEQEKEIDVSVTCEEENEISIGLQKLATKNSIYFDEEEKETSIGPEILATENTIYPVDQKLLADISSQVYEDDNSSMISRYCYDSSEYGKKLSVVLSMPYDQNDYEELWKKASDCKPMIREKHLRSMSKSYATNEKGLSYLDYYPEKIESADCYDRLILLRGFFFWLENLCHDGAFKPWVSLNPSYIPMTSDCELVLPLYSARDENWICI